MQAALHEFKLFFQSNITVREVAEALKSFDIHNKADDVQGFLEEKHFDVAGVRKNGDMIGYVLRDELTTDLSSAVHLFDTTDIPCLLDSTPLPDAVDALRDNDYVFVQSLGTIAGIFARADLDKQPVRMLAFGLLSMFEMQLTYLIRNTVELEFVTGCLTEKRLNSAKEVFENRRMHNQETDLLDCLCLTDKCKVFKQKDELREALGFRSKSKARSFIGDLNELRKLLAHAQPITGDKVERHLAIMKEVEDAIERLEDSGSSHEFSCAS